MTVDKPSWKYQTGIGLLFACGAGLRILLWWVNPVENHFDDHYEPIFWFMHHGSIAPKDALWQAYHPPVFYVISAFIGKGALLLGTAEPTAVKLIQFLPCLYAILTLIAIRSILNHLPLSDLARLLAFGFVCFLPRHIYLSALHSNDSITVLAIAICTYLMLIAYEKQFAYPSVALLSIAMTVTLFTKYTAFVVLPMALGLLVPVVLQHIQLPQRRVFVSCIMLLGIPMVILGADLAMNSVRYGTLLPTNETIFNPSDTQPRIDTSMSSYATFKPWTTIQTPLLTPESIDSFWTLVHSRLWFDVEPKFLYFATADRSLWKAYYAWLRGEQEFPADLELNGFTRWTGSMLIGLGLIPLALMLIGTYDAVLRSFCRRGQAAAFQIFPILFVFTAAGIIAVSLRLPVYSAVKATYFMGALPAFAIFLGLGVMVCERYRIVAWGISAMLGLLAIMIAAHIVHIAYALEFKAGLSDQDIIRTPADIRTAHAGRVLPPAGLVLQRANALAQQGRFAAASSLYAQLEKLDPSNADVYANWGNVYLLQGDIDQAIVTYERALASNPDHLVAHLNLASVYTQQQNYERARTHYAAVLRLVPNHADAREGLAEINALVEKEGSSPKDCTNLP